MKFNAPLMKGVLLRRYKRFLVDVRLPSGEVMTAHCPNTGSMMGLVAEGNPVWLSTVEKEGRKYPCTLEMIQVDGSLVGVNTGRPNALVAEALQAGKIPELAAYGGGELPLLLQREVKYGTNCRIDLLLAGLEAPDGLVLAPCYIEVKNVTLKDDITGRALFPDAVTQRGTKHLQELALQVAAGNRAVAFFLVQRMDCEVFGVAEQIDPVYAAALREAMAAGVEVLAYGCTLSERGIVVDRRLELDL